MKLAFVADFYDCSHALRLGAQSLMIPLLCLRSIDIYRALLIASFFLRCAPVLAVASKSLILGDNGTFPGLEVLPEHVISMLGRSSQGVVSLLIVLQVRLKHAVTVPKSESFRTWQWFKRT